MAYEAKLSESEERFRATFEQAAVGMAHVAIDGSWLRVNRRLCEITGYPRDELLRLSFQDITHPDDLNLDLAQAQRLLVGEVETYSMEKRYVRKDGAFVWVNLTASLLRRPDGSPEHFISVVEDISARKETEERVARLAAIVESSEDAIVGRSLDADTIVSWNAAAERMFGWSAAEAVGGPVEMIIPPERRAEEAPILDRLRRGGRVELYETVRLRKDGTRLDVSLSVAPVRDAAGRVVGAAKILRDVSAEKVAEADRAFLLALADALQGDPNERELAAVATRRLGEYLGTLGCGFSDIDVEHDLLTLRPGYVRAGGVTPEAEYALPNLGRDWRATMEAGEPYVVADAATDPRTAGEPYERYHAPVGTRSFCVVPLVRLGRWRATLGVWDERPREWSEREVLLVREAATRVWPALENARLFDAERRARTTAESATHEARMLAESLEQVNRELLRVAATAEAANKAKSEFLAVMSHELRTPLNAIGGYAQLLEMGLFGEITDDQRQQIERIQRSQQHLLRVIEGVLAFTKVEVGQMAYHLEEFAASEALAGLELLITPQAEAKGVRVEVDTQSCRATVRADREKLRQIVLNLLSNAVKFTPVGGRVWVDCRAADEEIVVRVRDTGRGIRADQLEAVFEPFVQADMGLTREHGGTGLGLAISRQFARAMGGDVTAMSVVGQGSTFSLRLPRSDVSRRDATAGGR